MKTAKNTVVEDANVWVCELRDRAGFTVEAIAELWIGGERLGQDLEGDGAIEAGVLGFIDLAHPARAKR